MKIHELKIINPYFSDVLQGSKKFEVRINDRDFQVQVGDVVILREYDPALETYLGGAVKVKITYTLFGFDILEDISSPL